MINYVIRSPLATFLSRYVTKTISFRGTFSLGSDAEEKSEIGLLLDEANCILRSP